MNPFQTGFRPQTTLITNVPAEHSEHQAEASETPLPISPHGDVQSHSPPLDEPAAEDVSGLQTKRDRWAVLQSRGRLAQVLRHNDKPGLEQPSGGADDTLIYDVANIGDGVTSHLTTAFIADAPNQLPKAFRDNPLNAQGRFNLLTIGSKPGGVGRAYTAGVGYTADEPTNLLDYQMEFTHGRPNPIDGELLKLTLDLVDRRLASQRPFQFQQPYVEQLSGLSYSLRKDHENPYSLARFQRETMSASADSRDGHLLRRTYNGYVQDTLRRLLNENNKISATGIAGEVVGIRYDEPSRLFELSVAQPDLQRTRTIKARSVVLATGHEGDTVPDFLQAHAHSEEVYSGERITELTARIRQDPEHFRTCEGLIIGSGLTMNDVASALQGIDSHTFNVVSRHGYTHELPQAVPSLPEIEPALEEIYDALNLRNLLNHLGGSISVLHRAEGIDEFVALVKSIFTEAREAIEGLESERASLTIRGQSFDPTRVTKALLAQYMVFRYEGLRGQQLRDVFGDEAATEIVRRLLRDVDAPNGAWITASRTSTTDKNIACNRKLRDSGALWTDQVSNISPRGGRFHVEFVSGRTCDVSYIANCTGRTPEPGAGLGKDSLTQSLLGSGLIQPHGLGLGVAMDASGRAKPVRGRFSAEHRPNLFIASLVKAKGELVFPVNRDRDPLSNTVAESVLALRPLARQIGRAIVDDLTGWRHTPDHRKNYIYRETEVVVEERS